MAGISLTALESSLGDVLSLTRFILEIGPSASSDQSIVNALKLRCQNVDFSGVTVETIPVSLHGHEINFRGRQTFAKTLSASFIETVGGEVYTALWKWKEKVVGTRSGNGAYKSVYAGLGTLGIVDVSGNVALSQQIYNIFPTEISNLSLDGGASSPALLQVTFSYDFVLPYGVEIDTDGEEVSM
jgi:hypothetical protein